MLGSTLGSLMYGNYQLQYLYGNAVLGLPDQVYTSSRGLVQGFELKVSVFVVVYLNGRQGWLGFGAV